MEGVKFVHPPMSVFDPNTALFNCQNGTLNLETYSVPALGRDRIGRKKAYWRCQNEKYGWSWTTGLVITTFNIFCRALFSPAFGFCAEKRARTNYLV